MYEKVERLLEMLPYDESAQGKIWGLIKLPEALTSRDFTGSTLLHLLADRYNCAPAVESNEDSTLTLGKLQKPSLFIDSLIKDLLARGARITPDLKGTVLHYLSYYKSSFKDKQPLLAMLVAHANAEEINAIDSYGKTALHEAIEQDNLSALDILLTHPAIDVNIRTYRAPPECATYIPEKSTPIEAAILLGRSAIVDKLLSREDVNITVRKQYRDNNHASDDFPHLKVDIGCIRSTLLHLTAAIGDIETLKKLITKHGQKSLLIKGDRLFTPLHSACLNGQVEIVSLMLDRIALNSISRMSKRMSAAEFASFVNAVSQSGNHALGLVLENGLTVSDGDRYDSFIGNNEDLASLMPTYSEVTSRTDYPVESRLDEIFEIFINRSIFDVNMSLAISGNNLLHILVHNGNYDRLESLIRSCSSRLDFGRRNQKGQTVLRFAFDTHNLDMVQFLAEMAAEYNCDFDVNEYGEDISPVLKALSDWLEEDAFEGSLKGITTDDLLEIYKSGRAKKVTIDFKIATSKFNIRYDCELSLDQKSEIEQHVEFALLAHENSESGSLWFASYYEKCIAPKIKNQELFNYLLTHLAEGSADKRLPSFKGFTFTLELVDFSWKYVTLEDELEYSDIISYIGEKFDYRTDGSKCPHASVNQPLLIQFIKEGLRGDRFNIAYNYLKDRPEIDVQTLPQSLSATFDLKEDYSKLEAFLEFDNIDFGVRDDEGNDFTALLPAIHPMRIKIEQYIKEQARKFTATSYVATTSSTLSLGGI